MPTRGQRALGWIVDKIALGNNYNPQTGQYSNVGRGLLGRAGQVGITALTGNPFLGQVIKQLGENFADTGNPANFTQNESRLGDLINAFTSQTSGDIGPVTRLPINSRGGLSITNLPGVTATAPQLSGPAAPWSGLGTSTGNVFSGGSLGNWSTQPQGRNFGQAAGSFTPFGAGVIQNDSWGSAASGFGLGAGGSGASAGGFALADAMRANKRNRD